MKTKPATVLTVFLFAVVFSSHSNYLDVNEISLEKRNNSKIEVFTFVSNGNVMKGKIFLPASYETNKNLPTIYLIDFTEQHFKLAIDEFEKVIQGVQKLKGLDALIVSLEKIPDINAEPDNYKEHYTVYRDMASYVDRTYTSNSSRTFIGKGSESGIVMMTLFMEDPKSSIFDHFIATDPSGLYISALIKMIEHKKFPEDKTSKKLHFSFSTSNDRLKCNKLIFLIKEAQYPWLEFQSVEYTTTNYENTYPISFAAGIKYIFRDQY